jgi:hypothetical protein
MNDSYDFGDDIDDDDDVNVSVGGNGGDDSDGNGDANVGGDGDDRINSASYETSSGGSSRIKPVAQPPKKKLFGNPDDVHGIPETIGTIGKCVNAFLVLSFTPYMYCS